jgi:hypothetical protein
VLFPPPLIVQLGVVAWTTYVTPAATWPVASMPVVMAFGTGPPSSIIEPDARAELDVASRAWGLPPCSAARFSVGASFAMSGDGASDGKNEVIVHATDWPTLLEPGAVAHTVIYLAGTQIVEADVHLNAKDWTFAIGDVPGDVDLRSVLTHELGHVMGIGHSADARATMSAGLPPGIAARSLEDDDVAAICTLYPLAPPAFHGCDRGDPPCPSGTACVGHDCERSNEPGTNGGPCATSAFAHACDGAGDRASCIATSDGDRCALPCPTDPKDDCGNALACVEGNCLPVGATPIDDAGVDARDDALSDAGANGNSSSGGGGCTSSARRATEAPLLSLAALIALRRRRARSTAT